MVETTVNENEFPNSLSPEQRKFLDTLLAMAEGLLPQRIIIKEYQNEKYVDVIRIFFLTKYIRTFKAILILTDNKFGEDAAILHRSLFEIWVKVLHMEDYPKESGLLYLIQAGRHKIKILANWRKSEGGNLPTDSEYTQIENGDRQLIKALIDRLGALSPELSEKVNIDFLRSESRNTLWPNKNLYDMLHETNPKTTVLYRSVYSAASDILHSNSGVKGGYFAEIDQTTVAPRVEPSGSFVVEMNFASAGMLIDILISLNKTLKLYKDAEIANVHSEFERLFVDEFREHV